MPVNVSDPMGIIVRKQALAAITLDSTKLLSVVEVERYYDEDVALVSLGPIWPEAINELVRRLTELGLQYPDDFFEICFDKPDWLQLSCTDKT